VRYETVGEAYIRVRRVYDKLRCMVEQDDGSNPERSRRLRRALEIIDGTLDGIEAYWECYD
jgi:hypothetical protein